MQPCDRGSLGTTPYFGETDETVNLKLKAAMRGGLIPIFCLGGNPGGTAGRSHLFCGKDSVARWNEGHRYRRSESFRDRVRTVWAIGTGQTATPAQAQEVHEFLRNELAAAYDDGLGNGARILYGGSVKPDNSGSLMGCKDIDGGLVGGASLKVEDFIGIITQGTENLGGNKRYVYNVHSRYSHHRVHCTDIDHPSPDWQRRRHWARFSEGAEAKTVFGSTGATPFLSKITIGAAVVFMVTSIVLTYFSGKVSTSVTEKSIMSEQTTTEAPMTPTAPPTPAPPRKRPSRKPLRRRALRPKVRSSLPPLAAPAPAGEKAPESK